MLSGYTGEEVKKMQQEKKFSRSSQAIHFELHIRVVPALGFRLRPNG
jgi:hypothetical protein